MLKESCLFAVKLSARGGGDEEENTVLDVSRTKENRVGSQRDVEPAITIPEMPIL